MTADNNDPNKLNDEASPNDDEDIIDLTDIVSDAEHTDDIALPDYTDEAISDSEKEETSPELGDDILENAIELEDELDKDIEIEFKMQAEAIRTMKIYTESGEELPAYQSGRVESPEISQVIYTVTGEIPSKGKIVLEIAENIEEHTISFKGENLSLTIEER